MVTDPLSDLLVHPILQPRGKKKKKKTNKTEQRVAEVNYLWEVPDLHFLELAQKQVLEQEVTLEAESSRQWGFLLEAQFSRKKGFLLEAHSSRQKGFLLEPQSSRQKGFVLRLEKAVWNERKRDEKQDPSAEWQPPTSPAYDFACFEATASNSASFSSPTLALL